MTTDDVRQLLLLQKRLYNLSLDMANKAECAEEETVKTFMQRVSNETRKLYFSACDLVAGHTWPSKERKKIR